MEPASRRTASGSIFMLIGIPFIRNAPAATGLAICVQRSSEEVLPPHMGQSMRTTDSRWRTKWFFEYCGLPTPGLWTWQIASAPLTVEQAPMPSKASPVQLVTHGTSCPTFNADRASDMFWVCARLSRVSRGQHQAEHGLAIRPVSRQPQRVHKTLAGIIRAQTHV